LRPEEGGESNSNFTHRLPKIQRLAGSGNTKGRKRQTRKKPGELA